MTPAELFEQIKASDDMFILPDVVAKITHMSEKKVRDQAIEDAKNGTCLLGYTCSVSGASVRVNKQSFIDFVSDNKK